MCVWHGVALLQVTVNFNVACETTVVNLLEAGAKHAVKETLERILQGQYSYIIYLGHFTAHYK